MSTLIRKYHLISFVFIFIALVFIITVFLTNSQKKLYRSKANENIAPTPEASPSAQIALLETMVESKNIETDNLINQYEQTIDEGEKQKLVSSLETNLTDRKKNLLSLLQLSPISVYNKSFTKDKIDRLNNLTPTIKDKRLVEERIDTITGIVNTTIYDNFDNNTSYTTATFIPDSNEEQEINFYPTDNQIFLSGTKVTLNDAVRIDEDNNNQVLGVSSVYAEEQPQEEKTNTSQSHLISTNIDIVSTEFLDTLGNQKILVLFAKTTDLDEKKLPSIQKIKDRIDGKINEFFKQNSYGKFSFEVEVIEKWFDVKPFDENSPIISAYTANHMYNQVLIDLLADKIDIDRYNRLAFIMIQGKFNKNAYRGVSTLGRVELKITKNNQIVKSILPTSRAIILLSRDSDAIYGESFKTSDGNFSHFDHVFSHEFIHSLGGHHAGAVWDCRYKEQPMPVRNKILFGPPSRFEKINNKNIFNQRLYFYNNAYCYYNQYENPFDVMGRGTYGFNINAYIKKYFNWIGVNSNGQIILIDPIKPDGTYTLKRTGENGAVAAYIPVAMDGYDYILEERLKPDTKEELLVINIAERPSPALSPSILYSTLSSNPKDLFEDFVNGMQIRVQQASKEEKTLTFSITSCDREIENGSNFNLISLHAGDGKSSSLNIFESDINHMEKDRGEAFIPVTSNFSIENKNCQKDRYQISQDLVINNYQTEIIGAHFYPFVIGQSIDLAGYDNITNDLRAIIKPYDRISSEDSNLTFNVVSSNNSINPIENTISKSLTFFFHLISTPEEYRNDLEPFIIEIKDKDNKSINHLRLSKKQTVRFISKVGNNSRNPDGNKSIDFIMKWYIQNDKGNNVIPPHTQRHGGIPPKSIDDAQPAVLTWTIPNDLPTGDYKILLEVDLNNRLQEFNENNNLIWRYFTVVE